MIIVRLVIALAEAIVRILWTAIQVVFVLIVVAILLLMFL